MIDAFTFFMGLTLAVTGWFLCRDYARFLGASYFLKGRVTSIQQVFVAPSLRDAREGRPQPVVSDGFYPVIEYTSPTGAISFTAIDRSTSGRFHVGDEVRLRVSKTRRKQNRVCKSFSMLALSLVLLMGVLLYAALFGELTLTRAQIVTGSFVIALGLAILVLYLRDQDESCIHEMQRTEGGRSQLCLFEPTAFNKWKQALRDPQQHSKIRSSQLFGSVCFGFAMLMWAMSVQPAVLVTIPF